jgi:hypothetical protein
MKSLNPELRVPGVSSALFALTVGVLSAGSGCSGSVTPAGGLGGPTDVLDAGGGGDATATDAAADGGGVDSAGPYACPAIGCAPSCPAGTLKDSHGCETCQCAPVGDAGDAGGTGTCISNADCPNNGLCGYLVAAACSATGQCFPGNGGARCALASAIGCGCGNNAIGIDPSCVSGLPSGYNPQPVLHAGACTDSGGACVSPKGGHCGGNIANPCTCAAGLTCTPGDSGAPFGDVGGTCE